MPAIFDALQEILSFGNCTSKNFSRNGIGKIGTTGFVLGAVGGLHFGAYLTITLLTSDIGSSPRISAIVRALVVCCLHTDACSIVLCCFLFRKCGLFTWACCASFTSWSSSPPPFTNPTPSPMNVRDPSACSRCCACVIVKTFSSRSVHREP